MRLAKADKLADEFQDKIVAWRMGGDTVDQILAKLRFEDLAPEALPGRTGMSLYVRKLDRAKEYLLRYRVATATLGRSFEEAAEAKEARLNLELLDGEVTERLFRMIEAGEEGAAQPSVKEIHGLAQLVFRLARARRTEVATTIAARKEKRAESERAARAEREAKKAQARGEWSEEQLRALKARSARQREEDREADEAWGGRGGEDGVCGAGLTAEAERPGIPSSPARFAHTLEAAGHATGMSGPSVRATLGRRQASQWEERDG